jgi:hypothetical protein
MVVLDNKRVDVGLERREGERWGGGRCARWSIAGEATEQQLLNRVEEAFDPASAARHARLGEHRDHLEVGVDLLQVGRGEIAAMVGIEPCGDAADMPLRRGFAPDGLSEDERGLEGRGRLKTDAEPSDGPAVIVHDHGQPGAGGLSLVIAEPDR